MNSRTYVIIRLWAVFVLGMAVTGIGWMPLFGWPGLIFPFAFGIASGQMFGQIMDRVK